MTSTHESDGDEVDAFFARCDLAPNTRSRCWIFVRDRYPSAVIHEVEFQGYCSFTFSVGQDTIVQFRPLVHKLDVRLTDAAHDIYGSLAPEVKVLGVLKCPHPFSICGRKEESSWCDDETIVMRDDGEQERGSLHVYSMTRIEGISLAELRRSHGASSLTTRQLRRQRESMIEQFASFVAAGWKAGRPASDPMVSSLGGRVAGSIKWRLEKMRSDIPQRFRSTVQTSLDRLHQIVSLPWVLTHGDTNAANVMVQPQANGDVLLSGLLDWAEAEFLPFGVGLYGLEELLGDAGPNGLFVYCPEAGRLREVFWTKLLEEIPCECGLDSSFRETVEAAHVLGVLLWHGIAFDNGNLNRVVEEGEDDDEIRRLDLFAAHHLALQKDNGGVETQSTTVTDSTPDPQKLQRFDLGDAFMDFWTYLQHLRLSNVYLRRS